MRSLSLANLLKTHKCIVLDSSVFFPDMGNTWNAEIHIKELSDLMSEDMKNPPEKRQLLTTKGVLEELAPVSLNLNFPYKIENPGSSFFVPPIPGRFGEISSFLIPYSERCGLLKIRDKKSENDLAMVSFVLSLCSNPGNYGFISGDRRVNEFLFQANLRLKTASPGSSPNYLKGKLDLYSFIHRSSEIRLYKDERRSPGFNTPFSEGIFYLSKKTGS